LIILPHENSSLYDQYYGQKSFSFYNCHVIILSFDGNYHLVIDATLWKQGLVLQLALQFNFWVVKDICNSLYLYVVSANEQIAWVAKLQNCNSSYIWCNSLQFNQNNSFSTTMQFHYNCTHNVMLMSLITIHLLKSNMTLWFFFT
jgi:hypothetical protein